MKHLPLTQHIKHGRQWVTTLKTSARPKVGALSVDSNGTDHALQILTPIWTTKTETAKRLRGRIENVLDCAAAHNYRDPMSPTRWRGHLDQLIPKPSRVKKVVHHPALPYSEVGRFFLALNNNGSLSAKALQLLILTATRTSEVLSARWSEIDLEEAV